ncbi:MAG: hypothetical protein LBT66_07640 [Methanobrevibacter sp.]|nr:hypothetical protein [Candidatus Methanovirga meridionalis]
MNLVRFSVPVSNVSLSSLEYDMFNVLEEFKQEISNINNNNINDSQALNLIKDLKNIINEKNLRLKSLKKIIVIIRSCYTIQLFKV